jgi:hypothetical protein
MRPRSTFKSLPAGDRKQDEAEYFNCYEANKLDEIYNTDFTIICVQTCIHKYYSLSYIFQTEN